MYINAHPIDLKLTTPFRISRGVQETSPNVIVEIVHQDYKGYGEASPTEYYGETPASVLACIELFKNDLGDDPFALEDILQRLDKTVGFVRSPIRLFASMLILHGHQKRRLGRLKPSLPTTSSLSNSQSHHMILQV